MVLHSRALPAHQSPKNITSLLQQKLHVALSPLAATDSGIAVAVSGGADSAMLAVHTASVAQILGLKLYFFHVHHGLYAKADDWALQVTCLGRALQVPVKVMPIQVSTTTGMGMEAAARQARYAALAQGAAKWDVTHILLAHHRDDQAETVLLRLLRGTGPTGLAAMADCISHQGVTYLRPWLTVPRTLIQQAAQAYQAQTGWTAAHDPSNEDPRYTRAALRTQLIPALNARWPGWQAILARHARLAEEAAQVLHDVACEDFETLAPDASGTTFSLVLWRQLTAARQAQVLRYWLARHGAKMPTEARLAELLKQLRQLHSLGCDRQFIWNHAGYWVRCQGGQVQIGQYVDKHKR